METLILTGLGALISSIGLGRAMAEHKAFIISNGKTAYEDFYELKEEKDMSVELPTVELSDKEVLTCKVNQ